MSRGFYNLTSGMLTQQRKINMSANNLANVNTPGYKKETAITPNFGEIMINKFNGGKPEELGEASLIRTMGDKQTLHTQGNIEETGSTTDMAIVGDGFFVVDSNGEEVYTRHGSFIIDELGYLAVKDLGRLQGEYGDVYVGNDNFNVSENGVLTREGSYVPEQIYVYNFDNMEELEKVNEKAFTTTEDAVMSDNINILHKYIEKSNVDVMKEMTDIISSQRALQTAAQALKMYDQIQDKAVNEIGRVNL